VSPAERALLLAIAETVKALAEALPVKQEATFAVRDLDRAIDRLEEEADPPPASEDL